MDRPPTATVFIGNIPYDVTEQMLVDMFSQAGPIKSMRLVTDKDSGKPKGYGFCEFHDVQTAQSAVRNLNKYEVNGRMLRVDFADEHTTDVRGKRDKEPRSGPRGGGDQHGLAPGPPPGTKPIGREAANAAATQMNGLLGNAPFTGPSQDKISTVIAGMTPMQLFEILSQMRTLCQQNHAAARSILVANPQLTKALFQAQILLGMVKGSAPPPSSMAAAMAQQSMPAPQPQPQQQQQPPQQPQAAPLGPPPHALVPPGAAPGQPPQSLPAQFSVAAGMPGAYVGPSGPQGAPQAVTVVGGMPGPMLIDPSTGLPYTVPPGAVIVPTTGPPPAAPQQPLLQPPPSQPPAPQPQQPPVAAAPAPDPTGVGAPAAPGPAPTPGASGPPASVTLPPNLAPQQAQVLQQVLSLTPAQIDALPPAQRQQVLLVRQQLGLGGLPS